MPKVLLVEDNEMNRDMLSRRLIRRGFEVSVAVDGEQGVSASADTPSLAGQESQYLVASLRAYKDGSRASDVMKGPATALDESAVLFQAGAAFLELFDRAIVFVPHLGDGIGLPEQVRHLVDLRHEGRPELVKDHGVSFTRVRRD